MFFLSEYLIFFFVDFAMASKKRGPMKIKNMPIKADVDSCLEDDNTVCSDLINNRLMSSCSNDTIKYIKSESDCMCDNYNCCDNQKEIVTEDSKKGMDEQKW